MSNIIKLTPTNFITWRLQVYALLESHELHCFLTDHDQSQSETKTDAASVAQTNSNFSAWRRQEKSLYSPLIGSLSLSVQPIVAQATSSRDIWQILNRIYGKSSRGYIKQLRQQVKQTTKANKSVNEYMHVIIEKSDQLALFGAPIEHEDMLNIIIDGLNEDYRSIIDSVNDQDCPISIDKLDKKLINRKNMLNAADGVANNLPMAANATNFSRSHQQQQPRSYSNSCGGYSSRGSGRQSRPYLGKCQLCGVQGHGTI